MKTQTDCRSVPLPALEPARCGRVAAVSGAEGFRRRLLELGFVPGTRVERLAGGLREPASNRVRGAIVALRRTDAAHVSVELE